MRNNILKLKRNWSQCSAGVMLSLFFFFMAADIKYNFHDLLFKMKVGVAAASSDTSVL